jgi:maleamate amidohydrolase
MAASILEEYELLAEDFRRRGLGGKVGFGKTPALVAVDFSNAFTDPSSAMGGDFSAEIEATRQLVEAGRERGMPTIYSVPRFAANLRDAGPFVTKIPGCDILAGETHWTQLDDRLADEDGVVLYKRYPSVFCGTDLASILVTHGVDTVIVTGITTSGCVRATAVDACSLGFKALVVREGVADRAELPHIATLFDLEMKYADIVTLDETVSYLQGARAGVAA